MKRILEKLVKNELFHQIEKEILEYIVSEASCQIVEYKKNSQVAVEGELCNCLSMILEGSISAQQYNTNGELIKIQQFKEGECFGSVLLFSSQPNYPYSLFTSKECTIFSIPFPIVEELLDRSKTFQRNYMKLLSDRVTMFKNKIQMLSQKNVGSRLVHFFMVEGDNYIEDSFFLPYTKTELSEFVGMTRPAVSRELKKLEEQGILELKKSKILISKSKLPLFFH